MATLRTLYGLSRNVSANYPSPTGGWFVNSRFKAWGRKRFTGTKATQSSCFDFFDPVLCCDSFMEEHKNQKGQRRWGGKRRSSLQVVGSDGQSEVNEAGFLRGGGQTGGGVWVFFLWGSGHGLKGK